MDTEEHIEHLMGILDSIPLKKITILTGRNGSGKSVIRKSLNSRVVAKAGKIGITGNRLLATYSMDDRAGIDPSRFMGFNRDCEWLPTGQNTLESLIGILKTKGRFIVIDEMEMGIGEELQAGICESINEGFNVDDTLGLLVITHSRTIVRWLRHDVFINMEGMTEEQWLNREVVPVRPCDFIKDSEQLRNAIQDRQD